MAQVCNTMDLTFTTKCIGINNSVCSPILTGPGPVEFTDAADFTNTFSVIFLGKDNHYIKRETVYGFEDYIFDFENYNYQIVNFHPESFFFKYTECHSLTGMQNINADLSNGSTAFLDTVSVIIPFIVIMIIFALGFNFLNNLISKSSKGSV